jgi:hypothetical protein
MKKLLIFISFFLLNFFSFSLTCSSTSTGNWTNPAIWSCGHVPGCGDNIVITGGTVVTVSTQLDYSGCLVPTLLTVNGSLTFATGNKMKLATGSVITLGASGTIVPGAGGGNSNLIDIAGVDVWSAGFGTATGPVVITQFTPLPIELISFTAVANEKNVVLGWSTATETNNDYFTIQRTSDGTRFDDINKVDGAGNSSSVINYSYTDTAPYEGKSYYRLKQTDFNGNFSCSSIIPVEFQGEHGFSFDFYPNPMTQNENLKISVTEKEQAEILVVVYDVNGKESFSKVVVTEITGNNVYAMDNSNQLSPGIYLITATSAQKIYSKRLIVQ